MLPYRLNSPIPFESKKQKQNTTQQNNNKKQKQKNPDNRGGQKAKYESLLF